MSRFIRSCNSFQFRGCQFDRTRYLKDVFLQGFAAKIAQQVHTMIVV